MKLGRLYWPRQLSQNRSRSICHPLESPPAERNQPSRIGGIASESLTATADTHYAAIGTVSNVASRLCDEAKPGQILISPRVLLAVDKAVRIEPVGEFALKGIRRPMAAYNVISTAESKSLN